MTEPTSSFLKQRILDQVIAVAMASQAPIRVGAILLKNNKVIASACNNYTKSHTFQYKISKHASIVYNEPNFSKKIFGHAETMVLKKIKNTLPDSIIVCKLYGKHNSTKLKLARPCKICTHLIKNFYPTIRHIHYSSEKGFLYEHYSLL